MSRRSSTPCTGGSCTGGICAGGICAGRRPFEISGSPASAPRPDPTPEQERDLNRRRDPSLNRSLDGGLNQSRDRGSATVLAAVLVVAMISVVVLVVQLGAAAIARTRAANAADSAALAGAAWVLQGESVACARATTLATAGGARIESCTIDGLDIRVVTSVGAGLLGSRATARARAGPDIGPTGGG